MNILIPLLSPVLLVSAASIAFGLLAYPFSARLGVASIGIGSIIMGAVILADIIPHGLSIAMIPLFGISVIVGLWMVYIAIMNG